MMKSFILLSALTAVVVAQSGISSTCSTYLTALNSKPPSRPASNPSSPPPPTTPTTTTVTSALNSLFSASDTNGCPDALIRGKLADFYTACTPELTGDSPNADVLLSYDMFHAMTPLQQAVCSKNDNGAHCVTQIPSDIVPASSKDSPNQLTLDAINSNLYTTTSSAPKIKRANTTTTVSPALVPNSATFRTSNLPTSPLRILHRLLRILHARFAHAVHQLPRSRPLSAGDHQHPLMGGHTSPSNSFLGSLSPSPSIHSPMRFLRNRIHQQSPAVSAVFRPSRVSSTFLDYLSDSDLVASLSLDNYQLLRLKRIVH